MIERYTAAIIQYMRINPEDQIAGVPIMKIRDFLKVAGDYGWYRERLVHLLKISTPQAEDLLR